MLDLPKEFLAAVATRYEVKDVIGYGGMATIVLARDLRYDREVAMKVLLPEQSSSLSEDRFIREIKVLSRLNHPRILPLYDSGHAAGLLYYVMPYVRGETLQGRLAREERLPIQDALRIACQTAEALDYAHRHAVIHRDIKPSNILLSGPHALLADFGIARMVGAAGLTVGPLGPGTPEYMSPEQSLPGQEVDGRSDIFSLGVVLYEMLTGKLPFVSSTGAFEPTRRFTDPAPSPRMVRSEVPEPVARVVMKALERWPDERYGSALEFARALADVSGLGWATPTGVTPADNLALDGRNVADGTARKAGTSAILSTSGPARAWIAAAVIAALLGLAAVVVIAR